MNELDIEKIELDLLLEALHQRFGYDFRSYARASVERRVRGFLEHSGCETASELIPKVLRDEALFSRLAQALSVPVTEMFRDPAVYRSLRQVVFPKLRTWPRFKIWHAGCATGEEVYSLAILLREEGLYDQSTIYATDFNDAALAQARAGIYDVDRARGWSVAYREAGGTNALSEYYHARYSSMVFDASLRNNITFANHNLAVDSVFGEMHLVVCRNVLIYFDRELKDRALSLFTESLVHGGYLCLGTKEELRFSGAEAAFEEVDRRAKLYKRISAP